MKTFLVLQLRPEDETSDNEYEAILKFGNLRPEETTRIRIEKNGIPEINLDDYYGIIVGGSPFDISTPAEEKSDIQNKNEADFQTLFDKVVKQDFPFLGACSGSGLLGNYCGANISKKYGEPVGGVDIHINEEGKSDPLLEGFPETFRALVGHKEACDTTPPNATLLAYSDTCPVEMFRVGQNVYATQFHPEGDADGFIVRINTYKNHGYFPAETAADLIKEVSKEKTPFSNQVLTRFVKKYKSE